jgi:hypothetical protein
MHASPPLRTFFDLTRGRFAHLPLQKGQTARDILRESDISSSVSLTLLLLVAALCYRRWAQ